MKDRWIFPCHVYRSDSAANYFGKRWNGSIRTCFPQLLLSPQLLSLVWRFSRPSPHVACMHVATLFTNTLPGVPEGVPEAPRGCHAAGPSSLRTTCESPCFSPTYAAARSNRGQRQGCDGLAESASSFGFARFTFKQYSGQGFRARLSMVSQK